MKYTAQAHWEGSLKSGKGTLSTQSGVLKKAKYSFKSRFEEVNEATNPEELLAATHAGCFTMAVCTSLTQKGFDPRTLDTEAVVTMEAQGITGIHLSISGKVENLSEDEFEHVVNYEGKNCIISKALQVPVSTNARLVA
jgi:osmotically inducible protein OsmC